MSNFKNKKINSENELFLRYAIEYENSFNGMLLPCNWITDSKIAVCFGKYGISAVDYHGSQPVSRNAKMIKSGLEDPAFRFLTNKELELSDYKALPYKCKFLLKNDNSIFAEATCFTFDSVLFLHFETEPCSSFDISFNMKSFYTNVHGNMTWDSGIIRKNSITFKGINRYLLSDWIKQKGAYLVPVKEHKRIFNTEEWIDVNNLDVLPIADEDILRSNELFIDSQCCMVIHSFNKFTTERDKEGKKIILSFKNISSSIDLCICFGDTAHEAQSKALNMIKDKENLEIIQDKRYEEIIANSPAISMEKFNSTKILFSSIPMYVESAKQSQSGMTRASSSSYYWVWGWDNIVTAMEMSKWNDYKGQKDIISFILSHRWIDGSVPHRYDREYNVMQTMHFCAEDSLFIILAYQYCIDAEDYAYLKEIYADLKQIWMGLVNKTDAKGYIKGPGFYPDNLKALGRNENSRTAMETGTFYTACRIMEITASILNDILTKELAFDIFTKIEDNYIKDFFNEEYGTLIDSIYDDNSQNITFPLYAYMGAYTSFGYSLFYKKINQIATFINQNYVHPMGIRVMPLYDKNRNNESVHHSWYPHWDIYAMKLLRKGFMIGKDRYRTTSAILHYLNLTERMWEGYKAVMELLELDTADYMEGWKQHGQAWNCNCATGIFRTIIESAAGIITDFGNIRILPDGCSNVNISNLTVRKGRWAVSSFGTEEFSYIVVDGIKLFKTCVIPDEFMTKDNHLLQIFNTSESYDFMICSFTGGCIKNYKESEFLISFNAECAATADLVIMATKSFKIYIDNESWPVRNLNNEYYLIRLKDSCTINIELI